MSKRVQVPLHATKEQKTAWRKQADADGIKSLSEWIRDTLDKACQDEPAETLPGWGDNNRKVKCAYCGHEQPASYLDCEKCGEDEFYTVQN